MSRLNEANVLAMSGRAIEAAGDVDILMLDKTGTITLGNRQAAEFIPVDGIDPAELADAPSFPRWPTRPPRAAPSSSSPRSSSVCAAAHSRIRVWSSSRSPRQHVCPA